METRKFVNLNLSDFEAFDFGGDPAANVWDAPWVSQVKPDLVFYAVNIYNQNTGTERMDARSQPARKNLSGVPCVAGWCGTTNNVNVTGDGQWEIVTVDHSYGNGLYDVTAQRI